MGPSFHRNGKSFPIWPKHRPLIALQEDEFIVYEPYCANYTNASEIMLAEEQNLMVGGLSCYGLWSLIVLARTIII